MGLMPGTEATVTVPRPRLRPRGTLAVSVPSGIPVESTPTERWIWANGAVLQSDGCGHVEAAAIDCEDFSLTDYEEWGEPTAFDPFLVWAARQCGVLSGRGGELAEVAARRVAEDISFQVARELYTGTLTTNPAIVASPTVITTAAAVPLQQAFYLFEQFAASQIGNLSAVLHLSPALLANAAHLDLLEEEMDDSGATSYFTPTGHLVIGDAGYDGRIPSGSPVDENGDPVAPDALGDGEEFIYMTGPVAWEYGPEQVSAPTDAGSTSDRSGDWRTNRLRAFAQRPAIALFDPLCLHAAVLTKFC